MLNSHFYKIMLPQYIFCTIAFYMLFIDFGFTKILLMALGLYLPGIIGNTIGFHRYLTHQSFKTSKFWHYTLIALGSMTGQGSPIFWTALHLHHHRNSDNEKDVHSPKKGFWHSFVGWQLTTDFTRTEGLIAPRALYRDKVIRFLHNHYTKIYWAVGLILLLISVNVFLYFFCVGAFFLTSLVDNFSNYYLHNKNFGYTNFDTKDNSRNNRIISFITLGGGWHNNHHHDPKNYKFGLKENEPDVGAKFIEYIKHG
jgi:fatty-acid desaturase